MIRTPMGQKPGGTMLKKIKHFLKETSGSIAPTAAIMLIPLVIAAGAALDYTTYANTRTKMQSVIDSAALATSKRAIDIAGITPPDQMEAKLTEYADRFVKANLPEDLFRTEYDIHVTYAEPESALDIEKSVKVEAKVSYDTIFGGFNGSDGGQLLVVDKINEGLESLVVFGNRSVEVALVVDNSGSMSGRKINELKDASKNLVESLFNTVNSENELDRQRVKMAIVPFSAMVNIGTEYKVVTRRDEVTGEVSEVTRPTINRQWFDYLGWASYHHENFDWSTYTSDTRLRKPFKNSVQERRSGSWKWLSRLDVYKMLDVEWKGCVEMRPYPFNTQDVATERRKNWRRLTGASWGGYPTKRDMDMLFVPTFAPDAPDKFYQYHTDENLNPDSTSNLQINSSNGSYDNTERERDKWAFGEQNYLDDFTTLRDNDNIIGDKHVVNHVYEWYDAPGGVRRIREPGDPQHFGTDHQIRRTDYMGKYVSPKKWASDDLTIDNNKDISNGWRGPNFGCTTRPITPLTTDRDQLLEEIDKLNATFTTNIQAGLAWGWRVLSRGEPFTQGRSSDNEDNLKFAILLSDGQNFYGRRNTPDRSIYGAWGYGRPESLERNRWMEGPTSGSVDYTHLRLAQGVEPQDLAGTIYAGDSYDTTPEKIWEFEVLMNAHTIQTCNNVKDDGVSVYTIAFDLAGNNNQRTNEMLEDCAGSGLDEDGEELVPNTNFFYQVQNGQLDAAFEQIGAQISEIRISR